MKWKRVVGQALVALAATVLTVELGEFVILACAWLFTVRDVVPLHDRIAVLAPTLLTIVTVLPTCAASVVSLAVRRARPARQAFLAFALLTATSQTLLLVLSSFGLGGVWLREFFDAKHSTFIVGVASALLLIAAVRIVRPWESPPHPSADFL